MNQPTFQLDRFKVASLSSDDQFKHLLDTIRTAINKDRERAGYKPYSFPYFRKLLKQSGFTADNTNALEIAWNGCRDAEVPTRAFQARLKALRK